MIIILGRIILIYTAIADAATTAILLYYYWQ
jgi:hypothetical protein